MRRALLWNIGAAAWSLRKAALPALAQGCTGLRTSELVVARDAVLKELPKFVTTQCASSNGGTKRGTLAARRPVRYRMYLYLIPR